jgi:hypothetical protein
MLTRSERFRAACIYLGAAAVGHLAWEAFQLPLYTIWTSAGQWEIAFAVAHCTAGDILIAASTLIAAISVSRSWSWPRADWIEVSVLTIIFGVAYTAYSEWINVYVRHAWAYSVNMPVIGIGGIELGLSPLLQWLVVPVAAFDIVRRYLIRCLNK